MHPRLQFYFDEIESSRSDLLDEVSMLSETDFAKQGVNGKWSVAQILTHLLTAERLSLNYMKKKSLGVDKLSNSGAYESFKIAALKISQRIPLKYKAPRVLVEHTPPALSRDEAVSQWNVLREELRSFLEAIDVLNVRKKIYKHAIAGRLDVMQAMQFFQEHIRHHYPQIRAHLALKNSR